MSLKNMMLVSLAVSVVLGLIGGMGVMQYLAKQEVQGFAIVQAKMDIPAKTVLTEDYLAPLIVPQGFNAFTKLTVLWGDRALIIGKTAETDIKAEQVVVYSDFDPLKNKRTILDKLGPEYRVLTLPISGTAAVNSMVEPGDYVDVIGTFQPQQQRTAQVPAALASLLNPNRAPEGKESDALRQLMAGNPDAMKELMAGNAEAAKDLIAPKGSAAGSPEAKALQSGEKPGIYTRTIWRGLYVIGVDQRFTDRRYAVGGAPPPSSFSSITVRVTPREAELFTFVQALGAKLTLTLRPDNAKDPVEATLVDLDVFTRAIEDRLKEPPPIENKTPSQPQKAPETAEKP